MSRELVETVLAAHLDLTIAPNGEKFEDRRRSLLIPVIDAMPGGRTRWGILKKTGGVPSDIIVDLNLDHYDVFSGTDLGDGRSRVTANFKNYGDFRKVNPKWRRATVQEALAEGWIDPLPGAPQLPEPVPVPPTVPSPGNPPPFDRLARLEQQMRAIHDATRS